MVPYILILTTAPSMKIARQISFVLVKNKLAACVNIIPNIRSLYHWKRKFCDDEELLLLIKTRKSYYRKVRNELKTIHPYDVPEIISFDIDRGSKEYLKWIKDNT